MDVRTVELFTSILGVSALSGGLAYVLASATGWRVFDGVVTQVRESALWLAWLVAAASTVGSLYFSEVADYVPCRLCWFQRICMYPLAGILLVAAIRRDRNVRWYALPLLVAGIAVSTYHYVIEWRPSWGDGACSVGPSCTDVWFRRMGFVTLAFMALCGFVAIVALLFVNPSSGNRDAASDD